MAYLPTESLLPWSPFDHKCWLGLSEPVTRKAVQAAIDSKCLCGTPWDVEHWDSGVHVRRIAYLVTHGWTEPIEIDVGVPTLGCNIDWVILDGHHRLAAAIFRGDANVLVSVSGDVDYAGQLFNVPADSLLESNLKG